MLIESLIISFQRCLTQYGTIPILILSALFFLIVSRGRPLKHLKKVGPILRSSSREGMSSLAALSALIGGNLGTGNIAGVALALSQGGPGTLVWMTLMGILGMLIKYVGTYWGVYYQRHKEGKQSSYMGGPMVVWCQGLDRPWAGKIYGILLIIAALTTGNMVQMQALSQPWEALGWESHILIVLMMLSLAQGLLRGSRYFARMVVALVPWMTLLYMVVACLILWRERTWLAQALSWIWVCAWSPEAAFGGTTGYGLARILQVGFDRALLATDAGVGLAPVVHASVPCPSHMSREKHAHQQALVSMLSPPVVIVLCWVTGLVSVVHQLSSGGEGAGSYMGALTHVMGASWAGIMMTIMLYLFGLTTMMTWAFCAGRVILYFFGSKYVRYFQIFFISCVPLGIIWCFSSSMLWVMADLAMNGMLWLNIMALLFLMRTSSMRRRFLKHC